MLKYKSVKLWLAAMVLSCLGGAVQYGVLLDLGASSDKALATLHYPAAMLLLFTLMASFILQVERHRNGELIKSKVLQRMIELY